MNEKERYCVHYWLNSSTPSVDDLVKTMQMTALLVEAECRVNKFGNFISVYLITEEVHVGTLSSLGTPVYAGKI